MLFVTDGPRRAPIPTEMYMVALDQAQGYSSGEVQISEHWLDFDGTRYSCRVIAGSHQIVLLAGHGEHKGTWAAFSNGSSVLAWSYLSEKLQLREGDRPGWSRLFSSILRNRYYDPVGEEDEE